MSSYRYYLCCALILCSTNLFSVDQSDKNNAAIIELNWYKLRNVVRKGSLEDFKRYEGLLPQLDHGQICTVQSIWSHCNEASTIVQAMWTTPGLEEYLDAMRRKYNVYQRYKKVIANKKAGVMVDPLYARALELLNIPLYVNVWGYVVSLKKRIMALPEAEQKPALLHNAERLAIIGVPINREHDLWVEDKSFFNEYGDLCATFKKLQQEENVLSPCWPTALDDEQGTVLQPACLYAFKTPT